MLEILPTMAIYISDFFCEGEREREIRGFNEVEEDRIFLRSTSQNPNISLIDSVCLCVFSSSYIIFRTIVIQFEAR